MGLKNKLAKFVSILLIGSGIYQTLYSGALLVLVYPQLKFGDGQSGTILYESLIEKAIVYYVLMIVNGVYGLGLLFKPKEKLTYIQIIGGLIIFALGFFFVTKTAVTTDPVVKFLIEFLTGLIKG